jgi:lysophospholipase L1-like esterase
MKHWIFLGIPIALASLDGAGAAPSDPRAARWESAIAAFEKADLAVVPPPAGRILFVGSSSIRMWRSLEQDFPQYAVINRGFGGSWISDVTHFIDRIVIPHAPEVIVFYAGENDLTDGQSPQQVGASFQRFVGQVREGLGDNTHIAFISMKPSPSRWHLAELKREGNALIEDFTRTGESLSYIDVFEGMLGPDGSPREELFLADQLHMNETGYAIWTEIVGQHLRRIDAPQGRGSVEAGAVGGD